MPRPARGNGSRSPASTHSRDQADVPAIEVVELDPRPLQELGERRRPTERPGQLAQLTDQRRSRLAQTLADVLQHVLPRDPLHQDRAAGRQVREPVLDLLVERHRGVGQERPVSQVETEVAVGLADEVEDGQALLLLEQPQPAAELLEEDRQALGRAEEQHRVDLGDVDALVVQVDDEQEVHLATAQAVLSRVAIGLRSLGREALGGIRPR